MHDPMVVAHEIPMPFPVRKSWRENYRSTRRWGFYRDRRTNAANLGEPVYRWWRPCGWHLRLAGREYALARFATVWHVEPGGRDMGEVCKHGRRADSMPRWRARITPWLKYIPERSTPEDPAAGRAWIVDNGWKYHVHHWRIQVHVLGRLKRFLFERCISCGHRFPWGYAPVSHQWEGPKTPWFRITKSAYHHQCSSLVSYERATVDRDDLLRSLFAAVRVATDEDEVTLLERLTRYDSTLPYHQRKILETALGYTREQDTNFRLEKAVCTACGEPIVPVHLAYHRHVDGVRGLYHREHVPAPVDA